jgi:hypothetical protein
MNGAVLENLRMDFDRLNRNVSGLDDRLIRIIQILESIDSSLMEMNSPEIIVKESDKEEECKEEK